MVTRISSGKRMLTILNYNESKVKEGAAKCILQNYFGHPVEKLSFHNKTARLEEYMQKNKRATRKAVHISINFHPDEKLSEEKLRDVTTRYMEEIGFGNQPYLAYQHFDAGHPHVHVVTTNITKEGNRISLFYFGKHFSEPARKKIETEFGLMKANGRRDKIDELNPVRLVYGKSETKRSIANVVTKVIQTWKYTSLPEFNAILRQYGVSADRGTEDSQVFQKRGLYYRLLDSKGNVTGVPIKASSLYNKPTLAFLEKQFSGNDIARKAHRNRIAMCIDDAFGSRDTMRQSTFVDNLNRQGIFTLFRQNEEGRIYGVTFVDNKTKVVFNGSDLGKAYGANAITERLTGLTTTNPKLLRQTVDYVIPTEEEDRQFDAGLEKIISDLTESKQFDYSTPDAAMRRKKRRRKGSRN